MKGKKSKAVPLGKGIYTIKVTLAPQNEEEKELISLAETAQATEEQRALLDAYLFKAIKPYTIVGFESQKGSVFTLKVTDM